MNVDDLEGSKALKGGFENTIKAQSKTGGKVAQCVYVPSGDEKDVPVGGGNNGGSNGGSS